MRPSVLRFLSAPLLCSWLLLGSLPALAQETAEASASPEPAKASEDSWAFMTMMTGPIERIEASFLELGAPMPAFFQRESIERKFPFIGPGGLRGAGSIGMRMGPGEPGADKSTGILVFPVEPDIALLEAFTSRGAKPVPGAEDTVRMKGMYIRRTPDFLLMTMDSQSDIVRMDPLALEERLAAPGVLAELDLHLERWRKTEPATFYGLFNDKEDSKSAREDRRHSSALGRSIGMRLLDQVLSRMRLTLLDADTSVRLRVELEPLAPGPLPPFPKPAFPSSVVGRLDLAYSSTESSQWTKGFIEQFMNAAEKDDLFASAERANVDVDQMRAVFKGLLELFWTADALSVAVEPQKDKVVYYQVNQYRSPAGFTEQVAALVKQLNALDPKPRRRGPTFGLTASGAPGARTHRLTLPGSKFTVDFAESGTTVRIVVSFDGKRRLPALLKLPDEGTLSSSFSGMLNPNAAVDAYLEKGEILPFPLRLSTREKLRGQLITWNTRAEGTAAVVDIDVPKPLVQTVFEMMDRGPATADDSEP